MLIFLKTSLKKKRRKLQVDPPVGRFGKMFRSVKAALTGALFLFKKEKHSDPFALCIPMIVACTRVLSTGSSVQQLKKIGSN